MDINNGKYHIFRNRDIHETTKDVQEEEEEEELPHDQTRMLP